jgi:hypothetical protein
VLIDLIDHRQIVVGPLAAAPVDFIYADGVDLFEDAMIETPFDKPFHRSVEHLPTGAE